MKKKTLLIIYLLIFLVTSSFSQDKEFPKLTGPYLGQKPPGLKPEIFAPNIISTEKNELNCVFSPDGNEIFFTEWKNGVNTIMTMKQKNDQWGERTVASFSGKYSDVDPFITADGKRLYFSSMRPLDNTGDSKDSDIWYVEKLKTGDWDQPVRMKVPNTIGMDDYYTSISVKGTLYFSIFEKHGSPGNIYRSKLVDGQYVSVEQVKNPISTEDNEHDPFIAPDESYLVFSSDRMGGHGRGDLYISFQKENGTWTEPVNMGKEINSDGYEFCPMLSTDGKFLFFTRTINRNGDIYWVSAKIIEELRPK